MTTWHAPHDVLVRFSSAPEALDDVTAASVEQHLVACGDCRAVVAAAADPALLDRSWQQVVDVVDRPRPSLVERLLHHLGMPADIARAVGATPALRLAWLATLLLLSAAALAISRDTRSAAAFLVLAPVVPIGSVVLAFLPTEEPGGEAATATPRYGAALVLRRVVAVLVPTFVILAVAGLAVPERAAGGALWVLPALALALGCLALGTVIRLTTAAGLLASGWLVVVASVTVLDGRSIALADTPVFAPVGQGLFLALTLTALLGLYARRDRFSTMEVVW